MSSEFFDRVFSRINKLDAGSLKEQIKRLSGELAMMETVFRSIQEGIMIVSDKGRLVYANGAAEHLLSFKKEKLRGRLMSKFFGGIDWETEGDGRKQGKDDWAHLLTRELEITYPERRILSFYAVPMPEGADGGAGTLFIIRDVTRERDKEASALEDERLDAVKTLAASVAHEIGNPLNALNIHLQLLSREISRLPVTQKDNLGELAEIAKNEVSRLDSIITQFLSALRHGKPDFEPADVLPLIEETLDIMRVEVENRRIGIKVSGMERAKKVLADKGQIKQVFFNLIKNAMEAMPDGGKLDISISSTDSFLRIDFTDSGVGIAPESLGKIFEPYHTTKTRGTGLGLMIVERIVKEHGGEIEVSSKKGEGTRFRILLPHTERRIRKLTANG